RWCWHTRIRLGPRTRVRRTSSLPDGSRRPWRWSMSACSITLSSRAAMPSHLPTVDCSEPMSRRKYSSHSVQDLLQFMLGEDAIDLHRQLQDVGHQVHVYLRLLTKCITKS